MGIIFIGALVFLPSGSFHYRGGRLFCALLFIPVFIMGVVLFVKAPDLLKSRLDGNETEKTQKGVVLLSAVIFIAGFVTAGLDFRYGWSRVPIFVTVAASVIFLGSYALYAEVMRENAYLSRTIGVKDGQTVVDSGLYGIVRHPMYAATIIMFLAVPLILGSFWALIPFVFYPAVIVVRILNEEKVLTAELKGYAEYKLKVKYRIIPFIW